jgi:hypothetical protein
MTRDPNLPPAAPPTTTTSHPLPPPPLGAKPPYTPPIADYAGAYRACPGCGGGPLAEPGFTWWGGLVGHKLLGVEQCKRCKKWFVKGTGQPGDTRVMVYIVVGIVLGLGIAALWVFMSTQ